MLLVDHIKNNATMAKIPILQVQIGVVKTINKLFSICEVVFELAAIQNVSSKELFALRTYHQVKTELQIKGKNK